MRSYVNRLTSDVSFRTEAVIGDNSKFMTYDRDYWYGFSTLLAEGWTHSGGTEMLAQMHAKHDADGPKGGGPLFVLRAGSGDWQVLSRGRDVSQKTYALNSAYEDVGRWVDWVVHYRPSHDKPGILKIWKDGTLVVNQTDRATAYDDEFGPYWKMGMYLPWRDRDCCNDVPAAKEVFHDAFRVASGPNAGYLDVAPGNASEPIEVIEEQVIPTPAPAPAPEPVEVTEPVTESYVEIQGLTHKQHVSGTLPLAVAAAAPQGIEKIVLWADKTQIETRYDAAYGFYWFEFDSRQHSGLVRLKAVAFDDDGNKMRHTVRVVVD